MFPDLSKVFDRDFIIGNFLPVIIFVAFQIVTLHCIFTDIHYLATGSDTPAIFPAILRVLRPANTCSQQSALEPGDGRILVLSQSATTKAAADVLGKSSEPKELKTGIVIAPSDNYVLDSGERAVMHTFPGDRVYFSGDGAGVVRRDNREYYALKESDIVAREPSRVTRRPLPPTFSQLFSTKWVITVLLTCWLIGIFLMATERETFQLVEGYGKYNPLQWFAPREKRRFERLHHRIDELENKQTLTDQEDKEYTDLSLQAATEFPTELWLLPTKFGNIIRAFEVYSGVMYGLDAIPGWERLEAIIPTELREAAAAKKANLNFWFYLWLLGIITCIEFVSFVLKGYAPWYSLAALLVSTWIAKKLTEAAAREWGESIKAGIDLGMPELAQKLNYTVVPPDKKRERKRWKRYSEAILFRDPKELPNRSLTGSPVAIAPAPTSPSVPASPAPTSPTAGAAPITP